VDARDLIRNVPAVMGTGEIMVEQNVAERGVPWLGGRVELIACNHDRPFRYEGINEHAHAGLFMLAGCADATNRKIDGSPAPRGPVRRGEISFWRIGSRVGGHVTGNLRFLRLLVDPVFLQRASDSAAVDRASTPWLIGSSDLLTQQLAEDLALHLERGREIESLLVDGAASLLTLRLVQLASNFDIANKFDGRLATARLRLVLDYIESNLGRDIKLSELAGCVGLSATRFCHAFRKSTGVSPHQYVIARRIERSKVILCRKSANITELALTLGFNSQSHFTRVFRIATGSTPMRYRQQNS
jgi:AraC-like DNA-binding protein